MNGTHNSHQKPTNAMPWRARKSLMEIMTEENTRVRLAEILAGPCTTQVLTQKRNTSECAGSTEVRVLPLDDSEGQG